MNFFQCTANENVPKHVLDISLVSQKLMAVEVEIYSNIPYLFLNDIKCIENFGKMWKCTVKNKKFEFIIVTFFLPKLSQNNLILDFYSTKGQKTIFA